MGVNHFKLSIDALDVVTAVYREGRNTLSAAPTRYESDFAAYRLMQLIWMHVNSLTVLAMVPEAGTHAASAWLPLRAAYECALTVLWLTKEEDWKEREARWLGWVKQEEEYELKLAKHLEVFSPKEAAARRTHARQLAERREAITKLLPIAPHPKRPRLIDLVNQLMPGTEYYAPYCVASELTHGGPGSLSWASFTKADSIDLFPRLDWSRWSQAIRMASWCVSQPGTCVLQRAGADSRVVAKLIDAHNEVLRATIPLAKCPDGPL